MAETIALVGLVASIASLIDLSAKVVCRIRDFSSKASELPETFRNLVDCLPLLTSSIQHIDAQAASDGISTGAARELQQLIDSVSKEVEFVRQCLYHIVPSIDASRRERVKKSLRSLAREKKLQQAVERIHRIIDVLVLYQTTNTKDSIDELRSELAHLRLRNPPLQQAFGLCLASAPQIPSDAFIGRKKEIQQLHHCLSPDKIPQSQKIVSIVGIGGLGKTQLSLAYAREQRHSFTSVFWLDAQDRLTLQKSLASLTETVFRDLEHSQNNLSEESRVEHLRSWLGQSWNNQWLLIFDNYDDPDLPNVRSSTGYDIRPFFPNCGHGSILITTRSPRLQFSSLLKLQKLMHEDDSLSILSQRSGRDFRSDADAQALARRLDGLPLALATAGTFISQTRISCLEYLDAHETAWADLYGADSEQLLEYPDRVLSSTWTITYRRLQQHDANAAKLLTFFAYFDNQDIWFELIQASKTDQLPWIQIVTQSRLQFGRTMSKLYDYSLIEAVQPTDSGSYRLHRCFHDWVLQNFHSPPQESWMLAASYGVSEIMLDESHPQYWDMSRRLLKHAQWLSDERFASLWQACSLNGKAIQACRDLGDVLVDWHLFGSAEQMYQLALVADEKTRGNDHPSTLETVHKLGRLYLEQDRLREAEKMLQRAFVGKEKARGKDNLSTLLSVHELGCLYLEQGKLDEAEQMFQRALVGGGKGRGRHSLSPLMTVHELGRLYLEQHRLDEAEQMFQRALAGMEKAREKGHPLIIATTFNLGRIYKEQGRLDEAGYMFQRTLVSEEQFRGKDDLSTLETVHDLGHVRNEQGRIDEAEQMYKRVLVGRGKALGLAHQFTLDVAKDLIKLCQKSGNIKKAEQLLEQFPSVEI